MKAMVLICFLIAPFSASIAAENPLSIRVLKADRSGNHTYLLFQVNNASEQRFESSSWSCVFVNKGLPVHEERTRIENIPAKGQAIKREIQGFGGQFDSVECRLMQSRPATCAC